jgi:Mat/Ecp fimbriae periplasmic chaperone
MQRSKVFFFVCLTLMSLSAEAGIYLDRIIVQFAPEDRGREDVIVFNESTTENAFVEVSVQEIVNAGTEQEEKRVVTDPKKSNFLVTPAKMVIPPSGKKQVRLVDMKPASSDQERVFRVTFTPVLPPLTEEASVIRVVVSYQTLVLIPPRKPTDQLDYSRDGDRLVVSNKGNSFVLLDGGKQCPDPENCTEVPGKRLYAGNTWETTLPMTGPVSFQATSHNGVKKLTIE